MDFELVLPWRWTASSRPACSGFLIAGLLAAYMSNFAATVNAAPPYFVNDIYKRYINPNASARDLCAAELSQLVRGGGDRRPDRLVRLLGEFGGDLDRLRAMGRLHGLQRSEVVLVALQRLRLLLGHGHRHHGLADDPGILSRIPSLQNFATLHTLNLDVSLGFALVFVIGMIGCLLGTLLTPAQEDAVLMDFYRRVRPWGFWGPVKAKVMAQYPTFQPNQDFPRDMFNIVVGITWQVALVALPIYIVIRHQHSRHLVLPGRGRRDEHHPEVHLVRPYVQGERRDRGG